MSASPMARHVTESKAIPTRVLYKDHSELPDVYSSTPGGTLYSTTPGGTKIVYHKSALMNLRNSPISKTPPTFGIPEQLLRDAKCEKLKTSPAKKEKSPIKEIKKVEDDADQFEMDM